MTFIENLGVVLIVFSILWAISWIGERLLGFHQRWYRRLAAAVIGQAGGGAIAVSIAEQSGAQPEPVVVFTLALLIMMGVSVMFDLLLRRDPSNPSRGINVFRSLTTVRTRAANIRRYFQVIRIATRHGLSPGLRAGETPSSDLQVEGERSIAARLRHAMEEAGGVFVKFGQVLSTRADLLPPDVIAELSKLQDKVTPEPYAGIAELLTDELGDVPDRVFAWFDPHPLGSASIAQVHRARLVSGEDVVVKVQRPEIRPLIERDLGILLGLARTVQARTRWGRRFCVSELAERFAEVIREELDFRVEANNIQTIREGMGANPEIRIPTVYRQFTTTRVLVIEWIDGASIRTADHLLYQLGDHRTEVARRLFRTISRQIFLHSTFHADPHPGNVMMLPGGEIALIDFGLVGRLNVLQRAALRDLLVAVESQNPAALADALLDIATSRQDRDPEQLERVLAQFMARRLGQGMGTGAALFTDLFHILLDFGLAFPGEIGGVFRALIMLEGTLKIIDPDFQIMDESRALAKTWMRESLLPQSIQQAMTDELKNLLPILRRLPRRIDRIGAAVEHGELSVQVRLFADSEDTHFVSRLVNRVVLALVGAVIGLISVSLLQVQDGPILSGSLSLLDAVAYFGLVVSAALLLRVIAQVARDG